MAIHVRAVACDSEIRMQGFLLHEFLCMCVCVCVCVCLTEPERVCVTHSTYEACVVLSTTQAFLL